MKIDPTANNGNEIAESHENTAKKYRLDVIVIASILLVAIALVAISHFTAANGAFVEVTVGGEVIGKYPLALDSVYTLGGGTNVLTVKNGEAYMSYSSCPDHVCENTGRVSFVGQTIICLPNRISITVVGESDGYVDFVS